MTPIEEFLTDVLEDYTLEQLFSKLELDPVEVLTMLYNMGWYEYDDFYGPPEFFLWRL